MDINRLKNRLYIFKQVFLKLKLALEKDPNLDELFLDGTIQRFEFVYELSWKLMGNYLEYLGVEVYSPREIFGEAFKNGIIEDATEWIDLMENRNRIHHAYNDETAWDIYTKIKNNYVYLFEKFNEVISLKVK